MTSKKYLAGMILCLLASLGCSATSMPAASIIYSIAACVCAYRLGKENGPALLAMMEDHSPDAGKMGEDSARLDYIERTFSGMTNRERYLPVVMIWGKGANGRTLREACDKYMAKDAARAGERG
jgi:hypothetical protein